MDGKENLTAEGVANAVAQKMATEKENLVSKESFDAQVSKTEALKAELDTKAQELETVKQESTKNKESIEKLDNALKQKTKTTVSTKDLTELELAEAITEKVFKNNTDGVNGSISFKSAEFLNTEGDVAAGNNDGFATTGISEGLRTLWTQILSGVAKRRRRAAEWLNSFSSVRLNGVYLGKFSIKDNETLPVCIGECELKPSSQVDIDFYKHKACKIAENFCFTDEYLFSAGNFFDQILMVLRDRLSRAIPRELIKDIISQASDFQNVLGTTLPAGSNTYDAIRKVVLEIKQVGQTNIDQIHVTSEVLDDLANIKDDNGVYIFKCGCGDSSELFGQGISLIENDDLPDADGILFMDSSAVNRASIDEITVKEITDKADALRNKRTWLLETWFGSLVHPCDAEAVKYDTLADIKTQLGL